MSVALAVVSGTHLEQYWLALSPVCASVSTESPGDGLEFSPAARPPARTFNRRRPIKAATTVRRDGLDLFNLVNNDGEITMIRNIWIALSLGVGACTAEQIPGTHPIDMSAQAHVEECKKHLAIAQEQYQRARYMARVRGYITAAHAGDREQEIAKQHGQAAKALEPTAPSCP